MIVQTVQDKFNEAKVWLVTKSKSGHYGLIQQINGVTVGSSPRYGKSNIRKILHWITIN